MADGLTWSIVEKHVVWGYSGDKLGRGRIQPSYEMNQVAISRILKFLGAAASSFIDGNICQESGSQRHMRTMVLFLRTHPNQDIKELYSARLTYETRYSQSYDQAWHRANCYHGP